MAAETFFFRASVGEPDSSGSSTSFLCVVNTNLECYSEHGAPVADVSQAGGAALGAGDAEEEEEPAKEEGDELAEMARTRPVRRPPAERRVLQASRPRDKVAQLKLVPERRIAVRRTYSEFVKLRDALEKSGLPGAAALPALPAKRLFGSQSDAVTRERLAAFNALLTAIGASEALAAADATCAFLSSVARPDFDKVRLEAQERVREVLALPAAGWDVRYNKRDITVAVQKLADSHFYLVRSTILIPLPLERVMLHYRHTPNWREWMPDASFREVERVAEDAAVMLVSYRLPVVSNRDVLLYEAVAPGLPGAPDAPGGHMFARSVEHPECPKRRGWVRAQLRISVTLFEPTPGARDIAPQPPDRALSRPGSAAASRAGGGTQVTSVQHSDPRGNVPAEVVNRMLVKGKEQLKLMRTVMVDKLK